jgi:hypothetical protein
MRATIGVALTILLTACSTPQGPTRSPAAASGSIASGPSSSAGAASPASASSSSATSSPATAELIDKDLLKRGYKAARHDGKVFYCKTALTPDRFPVNRCYTAEQIRESDREVSSELNHLHMPGNCTGFGCR